MQIVGYDRTPDSALTVATEGELERVPLAPGASLDYALQGRHCAGAIVDGTHRPCGADEAPWCAVHTETWICARCRGTCLKDEMDCHVPHVVYLAIVAPDAVKVGVTTAERIETRLHEQGADRGVVIHEVENGRIAREIETEIGRELSERITVREKIRGLGHSVDESVWESSIAEYDPIHRYDPEYDLVTDGQPIPETMASGEVVGTKGRLVCFERGGSTYVTDLRDLVGHDVSEDDQDHERQAGLAAFG